jgi:uncharacterized membrane protein YqjE
VALGPSLGRLGAGVLLGVRQRLELASLDVEEEMLRLTGLIAGVLVTALLFTLALAAGAATIVVLYWDSARIAALLGVTLFFAAGGAVAASALTRSLRDKPRFLDATLTELERDRESWAARQP